ncbi:hypothetical protein [Sanguibacter inulinus]|uniref:hypothetical protein n=1 Tax=Sanguibacter inulinus TaxID=60922 RepID=UPI001C54E11E|nr:hypothetical protein [Sanguibacter inulinus]
MPTALAVPGVDLALRRLIASKQKGAMVDGIAGLADLESGLGAPVVPPAEARRL